MHSSALTPVFVGLRAALHLLFVALAALVIIRAIYTLPMHTAIAVVLLTLLLLATYAVGGFLARALGSRTHVLAYVWLLLVSLEWLSLVWLVPDAAYLVFPLFFLYLHLLPRPWGTISVLVATVLAIVALAMHTGWRIGGVIGPLVGAAVAVVIGLGYRSLALEGAERERLLAELIATRDQLVASEHESGVLAERARLAREIHDTVAQGLSSIQMLLHAAERSDGDRPGIEHIRLARETAAANLADTRRFIRELAPAALVDQGIGAALRRLDQTQWKSSKLAVDVRVSDTINLPMHIQTALLRIAQGAVANVIQHAEASAVVIILERDDVSVRMSVADNGRGFDLAAISAERDAGSRDSFGLTATQERVDQLGGTLTITTEPGNGTTIMVDLDLGIEDRIEVRIE